MNSKWRPFEEAREYARSLGLKNQKEWKAFSKSGDRPKDIPSAPDQVYKDSGWINWSDWLGNVAQYNWRPFEEAMEYAKSLGFKSYREWRAFVKSGNRPKDIPAAPDQTCKDSGWTNWGDWLGNADRRKWRPFDEAREYAKSLDLKNQKEWEAFSKSGNRPKDIPSNPDRLYKDSGWTGYGDWLGTGNVCRGDWCPFEEAREHVKSLGLKGLKEWHAFSKSGNRPKDIPSNPHQIYKDSGWTGYGDWLGTGTIKKGRKS
jgi:hypothetical protein